MKTLKPLVILFTFCRLIFNSAYRMIYAFLPIFGRAFGVDLQTMSLALTARSAVSSLGPFVASVSDLRSRKFGMLLGMGLFTAGTALVVFFPTFPFFVASIIISTVGKYVFDPGMQAFLGDRINYDQRGRLLAITEFGWSLAFVFGVPLAGYLIARNGWMSPFQIIRLAGVNRISLPLSSACLQMIISSRENQPCSGISGLYFVIPPPFWLWVLDYSPAPPTR